MYSNDRKSIRKKGKQESIQVLNYLLFSLMYKISILVKFLKQKWAEEKKK